MFEDINICDSIIFVVSILIVAFVFTSTRETEKHVRFADNDIFTMLEETKKSIIKFVKNMFFKTHIENGILKTTKYTSDSSYSEFFETKD
uniref:Uncharacterized protein n=1 Tax=viral metagenome TaxID=1070528 RepID=A0A6C0HYL7_9ZZZZ